MGRGVGKHRDAKGNWIGHRWVIDQGPKTNSLISTFPPNATQQIFQSGIKYELNRKKKKKAEGVP